MKKTLKAVGLLGGLFHASSITKIFHIFFYIISAIILQLTAYYPRKIININERSESEGSSIFSLVLKEFKEKITKIESYKSFLINKMSEQFKILEYSLIILFIISGAILLMSSTDLISMFLSIELQSYGLYILSTIYKNSEFATKGGLTYFLLGGLSSCFILLGTCLLYSNTATTNLEGIYIISSLSGDSYRTALIENLNNGYELSYINIALILMAVGFLFKVSAAPFHFWSPDVYDAIPTVVTTFVAIVAKISIFIFLLELLHYNSRSFFSSGGERETLLAFSTEESVYEFSWVNCLLVSSLLSLIIGTVLGLTQNRIKRLFAYSTISHVGFILLALSIDSAESIQAFLFYLIQYSLSNLNAFIILISIGYFYYINSSFVIPLSLWQSSSILKILTFVKYFDKIFEKKAQDNTIYENKSSISLLGRKEKQNSQYFDKQDQINSPIQFTKEIKSLYYINPVLALSLTITIFSFVGIPPLIGFFGKQMVLSAALDSGYYFITIIAILTSVISAVYYLNIIKEMFFFPEKVEHTLPSEPSELKFIKKNKEHLVRDLFNDTDISLSCRLSNLLGKEVIEQKLVLSNYLTITISILTLGILLFIFVPKELLSMANILALNLYDT